MRKIFLILIALFSIMIGCEKYKLNKIYGDYTILTLKTNGVDSFSQYNDSLSSNFSFFYDDINSKDVCYILGKRKDGAFSELYWSWRLVNNNTNLEIYKSVGISIGFGPFGTDKLPIWEILYLTRSKIKMKTLYNEQEYVVELEEK